MEELFSGEGCPKYISCEPAHNNYWYIQFESEEGAQKVSTVSYFATVHVPCFLCMLKYQFVQYFQNVCIAL